MEFPLEKVRKVLKIAKEPISLETPIGEEEDSHLGRFYRRQEDHVALGGNDQHGSGGTDAEDPVDPDAPGGKGAADAFRDQRAGGYHRRKNATEALEMPQESHDAGMPRPTADVN